MAGEREVEIRFCVSGWVKQTIKLPKNCELTVKQIQDKLEAGELFTTIQNKGDILDAHCKTYGKITDINNHCEYTEFVVEEYK